MAPERAKFVPPKCDPAAPFDRKKEWLTVYEAAMCWKGNDPWPQIVGGTANEGWLKANGDFGIYFALKESIERDRIPSDLVVKRYRKNGQPDILNTGIKREYLVSQYGARNPS